VTRDETTRSLERVVDADPSDTTAALALAVAKVRAGALAAVVEAHADRPTKYHAPRRIGRNRNTSGWSEPDRRATGRLYLWSADGTPELSRKTRIAAARAALLAVGIDPVAVTLTWSGKAGCSLCPCSPGYIIKITKQDPAGPKIGTRIREDAASPTDNIYGTVVVQASEPEPKTEMELIRDGLGIRNGGR